MIAAPPAPRGTSVVPGSLGRWGRPLLIAVVLVAAALRVAACGAHRVVDYDEGRYLDNAANIVQGRGLASHYTSHFFRRPADAPPLHPEDISSPLYPYLLSATFLAARTPPPEMHRVAQFWSVVPGCIVIALTFLLGRRLFGDRTALLASVLVALNPDMVILSTWAMTEMLYTTILLATLLLTLAGRPEGGPSSLRRWALIGLACGALYLIRTNGLAVAAALGLSALIPGGERAEGARRRLYAAAVFGAAFLATISPWLARNQAVFGSPTYTSMKHVAWSEDGRSLFTRGADPPSMRTYLRAHGSAGLAANLARRAARAASFLVWGDTGAYNLVCALFPLAVLLTWRDRRLAAGNLCVLVTALLLVGVPTWTGALSRYMLPLRPWMYIVVIGALVHVLPAIAWRRARDRSRGGPEPVGGWLASPEPARGLTAALAATAIVAVAWGSIGPMKRYVMEDLSGRDLVAREVAAWIAEETPPEAVLLEGAFVHQYAFLYDRPVVWVPAGGMDELLRAAADYGASYLVVSPELLRFHPELRPNFRVEDGGVHGADLPPALEEVYAGQGRRVVIWRIREEAA